MGELSRRDFLQSSLGATALAFGAAATVRAGEDPVPPDGADDLFIDTHVSLGRWPFRRISGDETSELARQLRGHGVTSAWAGSFEGLFHKDVASVNARLAAECGGSDGLFVPFGTVNPMLPAWEEDLRRCHEEHRMPGVRLHPGYHRYTLEDPVFGELLAGAAARGLIVQLVPWIEDERHQHPLMPIATTDLGPLAERVAAVPELRLVLANGFRAPRGKALSDLAKMERVYFDFGKLDVLDGLGQFLKVVPAEQVVFGSHSPMFYFESALLKFRESAVSGEQERMLRGENARRLLAWASSDDFHEKPRKTRKGDNST